MGLLSPAVVVRAKVGPGVETPSTNSTSCTLRLKFIAVTEVGPNITRDTLALVRSQSVIFKLLMPLLV